MAQLKTTNVHGDLHVSGDITQSGSKVYHEGNFDPDSKQDKLTAGTNVTISGNTISAVNTTYTTGTLAQLNAGTDTAGRLQTAKNLSDWLNNKGYVTTDTEYTAGSGLTLTGTEFSLPVTVTGSGSYVQSVVQNANGITVTLGTPPNTNTTYTAGNGLTLTGTSFSLPVTVSGSGSYVQSVTQGTNGIEVTLGTPPNTTYTTGTLAQLNTGTDTTGQLQSAKILNDWINNKGYVTTDTKYTAGSGLTLNGTTFSLPVTVSGSGTYVQSVTQNANGITVTLGTPPNTNTTYSAGDGLTLSGTTFSLPVTVSGSGSYVQSVTQNANGITVTLGTPPNTTYSAVSQAEAEAGTATTSRVWSAQRVRQSTATYTYSKTEVDNLVAGVATGTKVWQNKANVTQLEVNVYHKMAFSSPRTLKLPLNPPENSFVELYATTGDLKSTIIDPNGKTLMGLSESMEIDRKIYGLRLEFLDNSWRVGM